MYVSYISTLRLLSSVDVGFVRPFLMNLLALHFPCSSEPFLLDHVWIILLLCLMKQKRSDFLRYHGVVLLMSYCWRLARHTP